MDEDLEEKGYRQGVTQHLESIEKKLDMLLLMHKPKKDEGKLDMDKTMKQGEVPIGTIER